MAPTAKKSIVSGAKVDKVVLLLHGIRTQANWNEMVAKLLEDNARAKVIPIKYGFLDTFRFLFPFFTRNLAIKRFIREYRDAKLANPGLPISVIAHSFGTYVVTKALAFETDIVFDKVIFCGSIVPNNFRAAQYRAQLGKSPILNDCGTHDVWPLLAKAVTWGFGATGTFGFGTQGIRDRFNKFTHSAYFDRQFVSMYWISYINDGTIKPTKWESERPTPPYWHSLLGILPIRWLFPILFFVIILLPDISAYRRGSNVDVDSEIYVGHWMGVPRVSARVKLTNATFSSKQFFVADLYVISPDSKLSVLNLEFVNNCFQETPKVVIVSPFNSKICIFNYIGNLKNLYSTSTDVEALMVIKRVNTLQPDSNRILIDGDLLQKLERNASADMIWQTGNWKAEFVSLVFDLEGNALRSSDSKIKLRNVGSFDISAENMSAYKSIIDLYKTGIGVFYFWRDVVPSNLVEVNYRRRNDED